MPAPGAPWPPPAAEPARHEATAGTGAEEAEAVSGALPPDGTADREAGSQQVAEGTPPTRRAAGGRADRRRQARRIKRRRRRSALKELPILLGVAVVIALVLKSFLVQAFVIPSGSMENTIRIGDRVLVDKLTPWFGAEPHRGDVVVFRDPGGWLAGESTGGPPTLVQKGLSAVGLLPSANEQDLIKRVVGVGGDTVRCCDTGGHVTVNGTPLDEPYVHPGNPPSQLRFTVTVPIGRIFVMGDHRSNSADSRYHLDSAYRGTVPLDNVVGRAVAIAWPVGHWRRLEEPATFDTVHDPPGTGASASAPAARRVSTTSQPRFSETLTEPPILAELPLVMGVVGLSRTSGGRQRGVRSGCGGLGGRRAVRIRRTRRARGTR
ncbi:signal peptidase I [Streptomyces sp. NPDC059740]|uniref:signal peptidase I n=1 Tax=Streptomyces sp. NPDC059740 TaxID=3346926 RepID=UPI00364B7135